MKGQLKVSTPAEYIAKLEEPRKSDVARLDEIIRKASKLDPCIMSGLLAYGPYRYRYATGREGDTCRIGVASNQNYISLYICVADENGYLPERYKDQLPKASVGKSCVRFKRLSDLDPTVLKKMIREAAKAQLTTQAV